MKILLTNDDGIFSEGLRTLYNELKKVADIFVIVPETEKSATSHSINLLSPIRVKKVNINGLSCFIVSGTPVDCVKIGIKELIKEKIDMVVSGINPGPNLGMDILYSGTCSAASEGAILGIPSVSISIADYKNFNFEEGAKISLKIIKKIKSIKFPKDTILNINIPNRKLDEIKGVKITYQSESRFSEEYEKRMDPRGNIYFWLKGIFKEKSEKGSDVSAIKEGYVSITPIKLNLTDFSFLKKIKSFEKIEFK